MCLNLNLFNLCLSASNNNKSSNTNKSEKASHGSEPLKNRTTDPKSEKRSKRAKSHHAAATDNNNNSTLSITTSLIPADASLDSETLKAKSAALDLQGEFLILSFLKRL
jgi:hypothetical protein